MTEAVDATNDQKVPVKVGLGKIDIEQQTADLSEIEVENVDASMYAEQSVIQAVRYLLRAYGIRKSGAAIRDAIDISHQTIGPKEAVSALSVLGFKSSFGRLNVVDLSEDFFPLISFMNNGEAFIINSAPRSEKILITNPVDQKTEEVSLSEYESQ